MGMTTAPRETTDKITTCTLRPRTKRRQMLVTGMTEKETTGMATMTGMATTIMATTSWTLPGKQVNSLQTPTSLESTMPSIAQITMNAMPSKKLSNSHTATSMESTEMTMKTMVTMATMTGMASTQTMAPTSEHDPNKLS